MYSFNYVGPMCQMNMFVAVVLAKKGLRTVVYLTTV